MYEVNFTALKSAAEHLRSILTDLKKQIEELGSIKATLLNEQVWKGPAHSEYVTNFEKYQAALEELYNSAVTHLQVLQEEMEIYLRPER